MTKTGLDGLDALSVPDEKAGVVVPERVESGAGWRDRAGDPQLKQPGDTVRA